MEHEAPGGVACPIVCSLQSLKPYRGWNLTNLSYVCHQIFLSITQLWLDLNRDKTR